MALSLRKKTNIRVRQPLNKIMIPVLDDDFKDQIEAIKNLILSEVNIKKIEYVTDASGILIKKVKPNFKALGPKYGKLMKNIAVRINQFNQEDINKLETEGIIEIDLDGNLVEINISDVEILTEDIPGWVVANIDKLTVALDITISEQLKNEGIARELVNRIQNIRKDLNFEVTDKISIEIEKNENINNAINENYSYICSETLAESFNFVDKINDNKKLSVEITSDDNVFIKVMRIV